MKTGETVHDKGLYASECCLEEVTFEKKATFSRCPRCQARCSWELVANADVKTEAA